MSRKARAAAATDVTALSVHVRGDRSAALQRERSKLLQQICKKKAALKRESAAASAAALALKHRIMPLSREHGRLTQRIYEYFGELLEKGRLPRNARKTLEGFMWALEDAGLLEPGAVPEPAEAEPRGERGPTTAGESQSSRGEAEGAGPRGGQAAEPPGLRDLFRRLARSLHPDHARSEAERVSRTEVMKSITLAYRQGDLAHLLELERSLLAPPLERANSADELAALLDGNFELRAQLRRLNAEYKALRAGSPARIFSDLDGVEAAARRDIATLSELALRLQALRDGELGLDELLAPPRASPPEHSENVAEKPKRRGAEKRTSRPPR